MLLKMPGITSKNIFKILNKVESIAELVTLTFDKLKVILESESHAQQLYGFLHSKQNPEGAIVSNVKSGTAGKSRGPKFFKKGAGKKR